MSGGCSTALVSEPQVTEVEGSVAGGTVESFLQVTELEVRPEVTELRSIGETTTLETSTPGMDGAAGESLRDYAFTLGCRARWRHFLNYGGVPSSIAPLPMSSAGQIRGMAVRVDTSDPVAYTLRVLVNSTDVAQLTLPGGQTSASVTGLSAAVPSGADVQVRIDRSSGRDPSSFSFVSASLEIVET